ncbi:cell division protein FtsA [Patescibacteria group bacterium]|nr:MAG: cell division protein FtsA [Patescibacteria group bacterium]
MAEDFITGLDIGSKFVRVVVAQPALGIGEKETLQVIGAAEVPSEGISKGIITSIDDAVSSVSSALERAERMIGAEIRSAWIGVSGSHIISQTSKGVVGVSRPDGEIREEDVARAVEAAQTVATPPNYEILHVLPKTFTVDGQAGVKDPVGMNGIRLEVEAEIIQGLSAQIKNLTKCVYRTGVNIDDLVYGILAAAEAVTTPRMRDLGVVVAAVGGSTTGLIVFEGGDVLHTAVLPIGSEHITSDIAIGLRISIDAAEQLKLRYGSASPKEIGKREDITLRELGLAEDEIVSRRYVAEIIEARVEEIFDRVDRELKKIGRSGLLPAGVVLTGGGAKLPGMTEVAKRKLRLPASLGLPLGVSSITDRVQDLSFTTAVGLVHWGAIFAKKRRRLPSVRAVGEKFRNVGNAARGVKNWLQNLLP